MLLSEFLEEIDKLVKGTNDLYPNLGPMDPTKVKLHFASVRGDEEVLSIYPDDDEPTIFIDIGRDDE